jgi:hypothetical protein
MNNKPVRVVAWAWSLLACAYFAWAYFDLNSFTKTLSELYASLDVQLPLSARLVLAMRAYVYPLFFGSATIIVLVKGSVTACFALELRAAKRSFLRRNFSAW